MSRFVLDNFSQEERKEIASDCFEVKSTLHEKGELLGLCPFHKEKNKPSFSYNYKTDVYNCFVCPSSGNLVGLWLNAQGLENDTEGFKAFCNEFKIKRKAKPQGEPKKAARDEISRPLSSGKGEQSEKAEPIIAEGDFSSLPPLPVAWLERLAETRGWTAEGIAKLDLRLYTHTAERGRKQRLKLPLGQERIAIPVRDDQGILRNVRLYLPGADQEADGPKITSWGAGFGTAHLLPAPSSWLPGRLWYCEGEPDYIAAICKGLNAVTKTTGAKIHKEEWTEHFTGREVVFVYDADKTGLAGAEKGAEILAEVAELVRVVLWPSYLYESNQARRHDGKTKFSEFVLKHGGDYPQDHGEDLTDFFVKYKKDLPDLLDLLAKAKTFTTKDEEELSGCSRFFGGKNKNKFKPILLAEAMLADLEVRTSPLTSEPFRWNGVYWEKYKISYLRRKAVQMLEDEASTARVSDATNLVLDISVLEHGREFNDRPAWICLKNGMLNLETGELARHDREYLAAFALPVQYFPEKDPPACPRWLDFLEETIQHQDTIKQVQEFFGLCLTRETRFAKCLLLIGPGADGKSTFLNVLQAMVGEENCSSVAMGDLEKEFYRASIFNKILNTSSENEGKAFETAWFKKIVTGDFISASYKHKDFFEFRPFCKMVYSANKFPKALDNSDGFFRRILAIKFKKQFLGSDKDIFLTEKLLAELEGIFAWALEGLERLWRQGDFTFSPDSLATLNEYKETNNPVMTFVNERLQVDLEDKNRRISKSRLYAEYVKFCRECGFSQSSIITFGRELRVILPKLTEGRLLSADREKCYLGLSLDADPPPPPSAEAAPPG